MPGAIDAGITTTHSFLRNETYVTGHAGGSIGYSTSTLPVNVSASAGVVKNYDGINSITGPEYTISGSAGFEEISHSGWFGGGASSYMAGFSTDPFGGSIGGGYSWYIWGP